MYAKKIYAHEEFPGNGKIIYITQLVGAFRFYSVSRLGHPLSLLLGKARSAKKLILGNSRHSDM